MKTLGSNTVATAAFALCKDLVSAPARITVQSLLKDLEVSQHIDDRAGRSMFGYYARQFGGQFIGYVGLDSSRSRLGATLGALPPITSEERCLLVSAHLELVALNTACIGKLAVLQAGIAEAVDPYGTISADIMHPTERTRSTQYSLLNADLVARVIEAFQQSVLYEGVQRVPAHIRNGFKAGQLQAAVGQLDKVLRSPNVTTHSDDLTAIVLQTPKDFPARIGLTYQAALVGIRSALRILNQLIFQACQIDRLPVVNANNLAAVRGPNRSVAEDLVVATVTPTRELLHPRPGELVFLEHPHLPRALGGLAEIIAARYQMSKETGSLTKLSLHLVDDNLNPSPLYKSLSRNG